MYRYLWTIALGLAASLPALAQGDNPPMPSMPGMNMPAKQKAGQPAAASKPEMAMSSMGMSSSVDLIDPMSQEASGTAWLPSSSPMYGKMFMLKGNMLMLHGAAMPRYTDIGSKRGDRRFDAPNWGMAMFSHPLDSRSQLGLRAMLSLDPITEGGYGYPLLFQTGESWHHQPLHDRQHPHDLIDELAATYSHLVGGGKSAYLYLGYPGEPALGPPTYMHRLLAYDLADAPIGHHWQDATHVTFGVATVGINFGSKLKLEASQFTGREPDENRYSFDKPRFDSSSGRLSFNPDTNNAYQISYGFVKNAEGDGANQHRLTASWLYNKPLGEDSNFTTALVWGQNNLNTEGKSNSYLAEADYQRSRDTFFARVEDIQKSSQELVLPEESLLDRKFNLGAYTAGYVRDLTHGTGIDTGLGFAVTADTHPAALNTDYGRGTSLSFQVYLRFRPSRTKNMDMKNMDMKNMDMSGSQMPSMPSASPPEVAVKTSPAPVSVPSAVTVEKMPAIPETPSVGPQASPAAVAVSGITAVMAPNPPRAQGKNALILTVTGTDGKPLAGAPVTSSVSMVTMDMGTSHPSFTDLGDGRYQGQVQFSMPGPWKVAVTVLLPNGSTTKKTLTYKVGQ